MDQDLSFLEAIREQPGSRANRLVYADWLQDQGDPRGEFIHLQDKASRLPESAASRLALEAEAHALLLQHEAEWLGPLRGVVSNWEFRGGLLNWVTVEARTFLAHAEEWLPALPLLGLHLRKARGEIAALAACPQLAHLNGLYLGDNDLRDDELRVLLFSPHLRRLTTLYLQSNQISPAGVEALASSPHLPRLRELSLGHNRLREAGVQALIQTRHLRRLRRLNLTMTFLDRPGVQALRARN